jgi:hypothetical protein
MLKTAVPYLKKLFHFITQTQGIVCFYNAGENEQYPNDNANDIESRFFHSVFCFDVISKVTTICTCLSMLSLSSKITTIN